MMTNYFLASQPEIPILHRVIGGHESGHAENPPLSIKCILSGSACYRTEAGGKHRVGAGHYLLLNRGHNYSFEKETTTQVETFCLFFPHTLVPSIAAQCTLVDDELLEWDASSNLAFSHFEYRRPHGSQVSNQILRLRRRLCCNDLSDGEVEESLIRIGTSLVLENRNIRQRIAKLTYARQYTRVELFRRVQRARDFIHASYAMPLTLTEVAQIAAMSPFHFLRTFRQVTGETPMAYLRLVRLEQAARLLRNSTMSVSEIVFQVGYQSLASFSALFARHTRMTPTMYRQVNSQ